MNDAPVSEPVGKSVAMTLGVGLIAAFAFVTAQAFSDSNRRGQIEATVEMTAAGDTTYFQLSPAPPYPAAASLGGQPLYPVGAKSVRMDETEMLRAGRDDASGLTVYEAGPKAAKSDGEQPANGGRGLYVKVGPGQFLKVSASPPPPAAP